jgi:hypothetical protein
MTDDRDITQALLTIAPETDETPGWDEVVRRAEALAEPPARTAPVKRRPLRKRWLLVLAPLAMLSAGATLYVVSRSTTEALVANSIGCFSDPDPRAGVTIVDDHGDGPVATCATVWKTWNMPPTPTAARVAPGESPPLVACDGGRGAINVFPTSDASFCKKNGMAPMPADYQDLNARWVPVRDRMVEAVNEKCLDEADSRALVRRELDAAGFSDWQVVTGGGAWGGGFSPRLPCASLGFGDRTVVLAPMIRENPAPADVARAMLQRYGQPGVPRLLLESVQIEGWVGDTMLVSARTKDGYGYCANVGYFGTSSPGGCSPDMPTRSNAIDAQVHDPMDGPRLIFGRLTAAADGPETVKTLELLFENGQSKNIEPLGYPLPYFLSYVPSNQRGQTADIIGRDQDGREVVRQAVQLDAGWSNFPIRVPVE